MSRKILGHVSYHALDRTHTEISSVPRFPLFPCFLHVTLGVRPAMGCASLVCSAGPRPQPLVNTQAFNKATPSSVRASEEETLGPPGSPSLGKAVNSPVSAPQICLSLGTLPPPPGPSLGPDNISLDFLYDSFVLVDGS